mmetsp:Transcript_58328/g.125320  ORF Transcript_58328/g.125320 Transcript_58328/m.125320 type:complete len:202 (+) Transcript_58328:428-1033(+)
MPPSSVRRMSAPVHSPRASGAASARAASSFGNASSGTPRREELLSRTPRQPSGQRFTEPSPALTDEMLTCQKPFSGCATGTQESGDANRAGLWPPKATSARSPWSTGGRKRAKWGAGRPPPLLARRPKKLKSGPMERPSRPKPTMPSKGVDMKGSIVMFVTAMKSRSVQTSARELAAVRSAPRQTRSRTRSPAISPDPASS